MSCRKQVNLRGHMLQNWVWMGKRGRSMAECLVDTVFQVPAGSRWRLDVADPCSAYSLQDANLLRSARVDIVPLVLEGIVPN